MKISGKDEIWTVIVTVDGPAAALDIALEHATDGLSRFAAFDGFIAGVTHRSDDGERLVQYLQWRDAPAYQAALHDPSWERLETSRRFLALVKDGKLKMDVRTYSVAAVR